MNHVKAFQKLSRQSSLQLGFEHVAGFRVKRLSVIESDEQRNYIDIAENREKGLYDSKAFFMLSTSFSQLA
jgi:hypothetical protein